MAAGLVLDWRRGPDQAWWGLIHYVIEDAGGVGTSGETADLAIGVGDAQPPRAILEWLPARRLRPR